MEARLLIGGEHVAGAGAGLEVENPYTEAALASVYAALGRAGRLGHRHRLRGARGWASTPAVERGEMLRKVAVRLRARTDELAEIMTL